MASNLLAEKAILSALRKASATGKPSTINDGEVLTLIARPDGGGVGRRASR